MESSRPQDLNEMVGQADLVTRLRIVMAGARARETRAPHVMLSGPPGTGKTTLARIVAHELGLPLTTTSGPTLRRVGDLAGILTGLPHEGAVLFIDEIHRLPSVVEETLYEALEDGSLSVTVGSGSDARAVTLPLSPLTVVGATTKPGAVSAPLRDRFGFHASMAPYSDDELAAIVEREWRRLGATFEPEAPYVVATRAKGVPRRALHLAQRVLDVAAIMRQDVTPELAQRSLETFGIGENGLDETDWAILRALCVTFAGRAVGLDALAQALDLDVATIEREHEGSLVRAGYVVRTRTGRMATPEAYALVRA